MTSTTTVANLRSLLGQMSRGSMNLGYSACRPTEIVVISMVTMCR
jgi:hypothetical protein